MSRLPMLVGLVMLSGVLVVTAGQTGGDKKEGGDPPLKAKVQLPHGWGKLGIQGEQKKKIYAVRGRYGAEIDKLKEKIETLRKEMDQESYKLLTEDQKATLRKLGDKFSDPKDKKPEEKKPEEKKPGDKN